MFHGPETFEQMCIVSCQLGTWFPGAWGLNPEWDQSMQVEAEGFYATPQLFYLHEMVLGGVMCPTRGFLWNNNPGPYQAGKIAQENEDMITLSSRAMVLLILVGSNSCLMESPRCGTRYKPRSTYCIIRSLSALKVGMQYPLGKGEDCISSHLHGKQRCSLQMCLALNGL